MEVVLDDLPRLLDLADVFFVCINKLFFCYDVDMWALLNTAMTASCCRGSKIKF